MSLGVEIIGSEMFIVIPRNTSIPTTKKGHYTNTYEFVLYVLSCHTVQEVKGNLLNYLSPCFPLPFLLDIYFLVISKLHYMS